MPAPGGGALGAPWVAGGLLRTGSPGLASEAARVPQGAKTVLAQYRHWLQAFPGDVVLMQIGAFVERLQWPPRRLRADAAAGPSESGLRRMRATRRGAIEGFPLSQLRRRVAALLAAGSDVTFVGQAGESGTRVMARRPVARWVAASS